MPKISRAEANRKIKQILGKIDKMDKNLVKDVIKDLKALRNDVQLSLTSAGDFESRNLTAILSQIERATENFKAKLSAQTGVSQTTAWELGQNTINTAINSAVATGEGLLPLLSNSQLLAMQTGTMDLISDVSDSMKSKIRNEIRRATLGGQSAYNTMQNIDRIIGISKEEGITKKAEDIARTEMSRVFNTASFLRTKQSEEAGIKMLKWWLTAGDERVRDDHKQAGLDYSEENAIPSEEPFDVGGEKLMYPGDPLASAKQAVNCRCKAIYIASPESEMI